MDVFFDKYACIKKLSKCHLKLKTSRAWMLNKYEFMLKIQERKNVIKKQPSKSMTCTQKSFARDLSQHLIKKIIQKLLQELLWK